MSMTLLWVDAWHRVSCVASDVSQYMDSCCVSFVRPSVLCSCVASMVKVAIWGCCREVVSKLSLRRSA